MGKYITINGELYHTDNIAYIDLDPDEIMHWKYIKREKLANGKWRYYYDDSSLKSKLEAANNAYDEAKDAKDKYSTAKYHAELARLNDTPSQREIKISETASIMGAVKTGNLFIKELQQAEAKKEYKEAAAKAAKICAKHAAEGVLGLPLRVISKGIVAIANLFSGGKKNKGVETAASVKARGTNKKMISRNYKNKVAEYYEERNKSLKKPVSTAKKKAVRR